MVVKVHMRKLFLFLLICYPLMDILYNMFTNAESYATFSIMYMSISLMLLIGKNNGKISRKMVLFAICFFMYTLFFYEKSGSILLQFFFFLIFLDVCSEHNYLENAKVLICEFQKAILGMMVIYILLLVSTIISGKGIQIGWGTLILYGPFRLSHTLAYELLTLEALGLSIFKLTGKKIWVVLSAIFEVFILLTSVRSALLASAVLLLVFFRGFKLKRKIYLLIVAVILGGVLAYFGAYDQVVEKSMYALNNGSITNGREWLVESSMIIFKESNFVEKIFGSGYFHMIEANKRILGSAVQGHNDIFNVLICFGVFGLLMYIYYFSNYLKGKGSLGCLVFLFILLYFNGLFLYSPIVIALPLLRLFFMLYCEEKI